ncbi:hypothetical protein FO524_23375 [Bacillus mycoides]|nr:hypothetical protein [Bacillus mycoides]
MLTMSIRNKLNSVYLLRGDDSSFFLLQVNTKFRFEGLPFGGLFCIKSCKARKSRIFNRKIKHLKVQNNIL